MNSGPLLFFAPSPLLSSEGTLLTALIGITPDTLTYLSMCKTSNTQTFKNTHGIMIYILSIICCSHLLCLADLYSFVMDLLWLNNSPIDE